MRTNMILVYLIKNIFLNMRVLLLTVIQHTILIWCIHVRVCIIRCYKLSLKWSSISLMIKWLNASLLSIHFYRNVIIFTKFIENDSVTLLDKRTESRLDALVAYYQKSSIHANDGRIQWTNSIVKHINNEDVSAIYGKQYDRQLRTIHATGTGIYTSPLYKTKMMGLKQR